MSPRIEQRLMESVPHVGVAPGAVTVVVPVFNERRRLNSFAPSLAEFAARRAGGSELLFVDDGSTDGTIELLELFEQHAAKHGQRVRLLRRQHLGKGAALRAGLDAVTTPIAGFCDLDLSTSLPDFGRLVDAAAAAPILAIASRGLAASRLSRHQGRVREFLGRTFNKAVQIALVPGVVDTQCGAKVARTEIWKAILPFSAENGFAWDVEVLAIALRLGISVQEFAVEWHHEDESKVHVARDGIAMLHGLLRIRRGLRAQLPSAAPTVSLLPPQRAAPGARQDAALGDPRAVALTRADPGHWWFRSKASFIDWALKRSDGTSGRLVDLGSGTANVIAKLGWPLDDTIVVDANPVVARDAGRRFALEVVCAEPGRVALRSGTAAVVCLLDVLQRTSEPGALLHEAHRLLTPDGRMIVVVPGHPRLWSAADEALGHERRYTRAMLRAHLEREGFEVVFSSHIFSWLFVPVWLRRRRHASEAQLGFDVDSTLIDRFALFFTRVERVALRRIALPLGTSVLCVAKPRSDLSLRSNFP